MCNADIRRAIMAQGLKHWQIAKALGVAEGTFSRKLRSELSEETKKQIYDIIAELMVKEDTTNDR